MATKEMWEQIGEGFVGEYYRRFDKNELRPSLGELKIKEGMDTDVILGSMAIRHDTLCGKTGTGGSGNDSCLTWEGERFPGRTGIIGKLTSLPFGAIQHVITSQDHQPTPDNCIVSMVTGQLKADNDPVMGFQQIFMLRLQDGAWVCTNDIFRLALHNFA